jgi:hypothetical protein
MSPSVIHQTFIYAVSEHEIMSDVTVVSGKRFRDSLKSAKVKIVGLGAAGAGLVGTASAAVDINATIGPILDSVIALIPTIINLIVAIVPAVLVMAVIGFIVAFFDRILGMLKI